MPTIDELKKSVRDTVHETEWDEYEGEEPDLIHEIVDGAIPIHYDTLLELAEEETDLATEEPEIYAFDGKKNAVNSIAGNLFQLLKEVAWEEYNSLSD